MNYGFAPGGTPQDGRVRLLFARRPNTTLIAAQRGRTVVRQFIGHLNTSPAITRPVDDLLLGAHANDEGFLFAPMFAGQNGATTFETLEATLADPNKSIVIPNPLIGFTAGDPITHSFHIKGCNIGKAAPFLTKLKEALGDNVNVTAPKHFHGITEYAAQGVWEWMAYEYKISQRDPFANQAAAIAEFTAQNFTRIDGSTVPATEWAGWIPNRITQTDSRVITVNLGQTIGRRSTIQAIQEFRVRRGQFNYTITFPNSQSVPTTQPDREQALDQSLNSNPLFDAVHPFPEYVRWGYTSIADFLAGYQWTFSRSGAVLVCVGRRWEYTMLVPILDLATGDIIFNFYPNAGSPQAPITTGLQESDTDYFETV
ncbi:MAG TPA: hypothetical protein VF658_19300 [Pyrinomonadaceae bacterium]|jgi:hypothetical protein